MLSLPSGLLVWATDLQATNATIHVLKVCGLEDHSMVLRGILGVDFCSVTLPGIAIHTYHLYICLGD